MSGKYLLEGGAMEKAICTECGEEFARIRRNGNPAMTCSARCRTDRKNAQSLACIRKAREKDSTYDKKEKERNRRVRLSHRGETLAPHLPLYNSWGIDKKMIQNMRPDQIISNWDNILIGSGIYHTPLPINDRITDEVDV